MSRFYGTIKEGEFSLYHQDEFEIVKKSLEGKEIQIDLSKKTNPRSLQQNRYYWGVIIDILSEETGQPKEDIHDFLRGLFLKKNVAIADKYGEIEDISTTRSTTKLNTQEFMKYNEDIRRWSSMSLGIYIPDVNEQYSIDKMSAYYS